MPRIPRIVLPGVAHHATQRGARRMTVFFDDRDYREYVDLLSEQVEAQHIRVLVYCLMPNHVHLIAVPEDQRGLGRALGVAHRRYARRVNRRNGWRGHLWQERFWSFPMDDVHLARAVRYVLLNPVRAGLVDRADRWPHSNLSSLLTGAPDPLARPGSLVAQIGDGHTLLEPDESNPDLEELRRHTSTGLPLGEPGFLAPIEAALGRSLELRPRGRPPREIGDSYRSQERP